MFQSPDIPLSHMQSDDRCREHNGPRMFSYAQHSVLERLQKRKLGPCHVQLEVTVQLVL